MAVRFISKTPFAGGQSWRSYSLQGATLVALGAIWGGSFVLQRAAAPWFGAFPLVFLRLALGAMVLSPFLWRTRHRFTGSVWLRLAAVGMLTSAIPFALFAWGAERAPAAVGAITNSLTAPFAALVGLLLFHERIAALRAVGICVGFGGVLALVGVHFESGTSLAALAGTLASLCYGIGGQLLPRMLPGLPAPAIAAATLGAGAIVFAGPAIANWPAHQLSPTLWISVAVLGVICTGVAYALYFWLIAKLGAARAAAVTYLIPCFAVSLGWVFLDEHPTLRIMLAGGVIIIGVILSQAGGVSTRRAPQGASE